MPQESMKKVRVLQGHSVCHNGIWHHQGDEIVVPASTEFLTRRPKHDKEGKHLGDEEVSQVETITPEELQKEEG